MDEYVLPENSAANAATTESMGMCGETTQRGGCSVCALQKGALQPRKTENTAILPVLATVAFRSRGGGIESSADESP